MAKRAFIIGITAATQWAMPIIALALLLVLLGSDMTAKDAPRVQRAAKTGPIVFFVAPSGDDLGPGSSRRPFASLERARDAIRELKQASGQSFPGAIVRLRSGTYWRSGVFDLTAADSGADGAPIEYTVESGGVVRIVGGVRLAAWRRVTDVAILSRLSPAAQSHVFVTDVSQLKHGSMTPQGFGRTVTVAPAELFFGGAPMTVARWPNAGQFATITRPAVDVRNEAGSVTGDLPAGFFYDGERPRLWRKTDDIWVHGYWGFDWADSYERVGQLDADRHFIQTAPPFGVWGFTAGQRFYFSNVLEELDTPGEYYLDSSGKLYFWPPAPLQSSEVLLSTLDEPMLRLKNASNIVIRGLTMEVARGDAVVIDGATNIRLVGCTVRNVGNRGVVIRQSNNVTVASGEISQTGYAAVQVDAGDRKTLTPANVSIVNNEIHDYARRVRTYQAGINVNGVGVRIAHNRIFNAPHTAILFFANDIVIEDNDIHDVCLETGDCGAVYTGRDYSFRGNIIRNNAIHHVYGLNMGASAVYLDDCVSGTTVEGNVFWAAERGVLLGGGRDVSISNNVFYQCNRPLFVDGRCQSSDTNTHHMTYDTMRERLDAVNWRAAPYSEKYPGLISLRRYYDDPARLGIPPENNVVVRNIVVGGQWLSGDESRFVNATDNLVGLTPAFVDPRRGDFHLLPRSPASMIGFKAIALEAMGIIRDVDRDRVPPMRLLVAAAEVVEGGAIAGSEAPIRIRYTLRNLGQTTERGQETLFVAPMGAGGIVSGGSISYTLKRFESIASTVIVWPKKGAKRLQLVEYRDGESGPHRYFDIPIR
jgi:Right handed beta helix region